MQAGAGPIGLAARAGRPGSKSFTDAVVEFRSRGAVTRDVFDAMTAEERARSFTIARMLTDQGVAVVQDELSRAIEAGESLRKFRVNLRQRMQSSGIAIAPHWRSRGDEATLDALDASHVETVYRNGVMSAYSAGRAKHMTQPHIVAARPYWQVMTVNDGPPRQRPTHQAVHGWVMRADDPGWQVTYAPYGHRCRCRQIVRSAKWVERNSPRMHSGPLPKLPDPGWTCRPPPAVSIPAEPVPKPDTHDDPPLQPRPSRGPSLLRPGDEQLDNETRAALERLDSFDKDERGRLSMRQLGFREPAGDEVVRVKELLKLRGAQLDDAFARALPEPLGSYEVGTGAAVDGVAAADAVRAWDVVGLPRVLLLPDGRYHLLDGDAIAAAQASSARGLSSLGVLRARVVEAPLNRLPKAPPSRAAAVQELGEAAVGLGRDRASQARLRLALQDVLKGDGMLSRDNVEIRQFAERFSAIRSDVIRAGHAWNGAVEVSQPILDHAQAGLTAARAGRQLSSQQQRAISTLFHEEIHGASPMARSAYQGHGAALEEASAEILARRQARKLLGLKPGADEPLGLPTKPITSKAGAGEMAKIRPYEGPVSRLLATVARFDVPAADVEAALIRMRKADATRYETADAYLSGFVAELPVTEAQRPTLTRQLKRALRSTSLELERAIVAGVYELERNDTAGAVRVYEAAVGQASEPELQDLARMLARLQDNAASAAELLGYFEELGG